MHNHQTPEHIIVMKSDEIYWRPFKMKGPYITEAFTFQYDSKEEAIYAAQEWSKYCGLEFKP